MNIIAKAKAVHFRIVSGKVECATLEDLRRNLVISDIIEPINDGRLSKWLHSIKEDKIANSIDKKRPFYLDKEESVLEILYWITGKKINKEDFGSYIQYVENIQKYIPGLARKLLEDNLFKDVEILLYAYNSHKDIIENKENEFETFYNSSTNEKLYEFGLKLYEQEEGQVKKWGERMLKKSALNGHPDACGIYYNDIKKREDFTKLISNTLGGSLKKWRSNILYRKGKVIDALVDIKKNEIDKKQKEIFQLCIFFCKIFYFDQMNTYRDKLREESERTDYKELKWAINFLYTYATESEEYKEKKIEEYENIGHRVAKQHAKELRMDTNREKFHIDLNNGEKIIMPFNPNADQFREFVFSFLTSILYF